MPPRIPERASAFTLAARAEMVFRDLPFLERLRRISSLALQVDIRDWTTHDVDALAASGAVFSSMTGHVAGTGSME